MCWALSSLARFRGDRAWRPFATLFAGACALQWPLNTTGALPLWPRPPLGVETAPRLARLERELKEPLGGGCPADARTTTHRFAKFRPVWGLPVRLQGHFHRSGGLMEVRGIAAGRPARPAAGRGAGGARGRAHMAKARQGAPDGGGDGPSCGSGRRAATPGGIGSCGSRLGGRAPPGAREPDSEPSPHAEDLAQPHRLRGRGLEGGLRPIHLACSRIPGSDACGTGRAKVLVRRSTT